MRRPVPLMPALPLRRGLRSAGLLLSLAAMSALTIAPLARAQSGRGQAVAVAMTPLLPLGASPQEAARASGLLQAELRSLPEVIPVDAARVRSVTGRTEFARCDDTACLVRLGRALGVPRVIGGDVGSLAGSFVVNLRLIDVTAGKEARAVTAPLPLGEGDGPRAARAALVRLVAPQRYTGALQVNVDVVGATLYLDGRPIGVSPAGRITGIGVGTHALRVSKEEYRDFLAFVQIEYGQTQIINAPLSAFPVVNEEVLARRQAVKGTPWYRRWWALALLGAVVATGVGLGVGLSGSIPADHTARIR